MKKICVSFYLWKKQENNERYKPVAVLYSADEISSSILLSCFPAVFKNITPTILNKEDISKIMSYIKENGDNMKLTIPDLWSCPVDCISHLSFILKFIFSMLNYPLNSDLIIGVVYE